RTARWNEAEANFKRAVELDPRNFVVLMEAGSLFQATRRYGEAKLLYEQCLGILPNDPFARNLLGFGFFAETGDTEAWRKQLDLVTQQSPGAARLPTGLELPWFNRCHARPVRRSDGGRKTRL